MEEIHGYTALCEAVWQNNTGMAELLVSRGARVTTQSHMLLHCAVTQGNTAMARLLLNARSVPNLRDDHGNTPLLLAAKQVNNSHYFSIPILISIFCYFLARAISEWLSFYWSMGRILITQML